MNTSKPPALRNIRNDIPGHLPDELTEILVHSSDIKIERIVSMGHATPAGQWYDQDQNEFVILLEGEASLEFDEPPNTIDMKSGDHMTIPAHVRHRVVWTKPDSYCIWLAVFY